MNTNITTCPPLVPAWATRLRGAAVALAALAMAASATGAQANVLSNGSFETFGGSSAQCNSGGGSNTQQVTTSDLSSWTPDSNTNYSFILNTGNYGSFSNSYNGNGGSCIGLQPSITASPDGGNFFATDASYLNGGTYTIATAITGLVSGATYNLSFYMGAGQQKNFSGPSTDDWLVGLGATAGTAGTTANQTTPGVALPNGGFSGWVAETMQFVAGASSQVLWFMGQSTAQSGQPPFVLLDGVNLSMNNSVTPVPEPPAYAMLMAGLLALLGVRRSYRRKG